MAFENKYYTDLIEINKLIDEDKINGEGNALDKFKTHLDEIVEIGRFSKDEWKTKWRSAVYRFGEKFKDKDPIEFLNILKSKRKGLEKDKKELIDFYYSEIDGNSLPKDASALRFEKLVDKYPYNPEFRHTLGHFYSNKKKYKKAIEQYEFARLKDTDNQTYKKSMFSCYVKYLETFIDDSKYSQGLEICQNLIEKRIFWDTGIMHNYIIGLKERFKDYIILNEKIENAEQTIKEIVAKETQKGQMRIIEILGFFTAIIAFIFSTISIGKNFSFNEAIIFNISLGLTLLIFALIINLFFSRVNVSRTDYRILIVIILVISLLLIVAKFGIPIWIK